MKASVFKAPSAQLAIENVHPTRGLGRTVDKARAAGLNHPIMPQIIDVLGARSRQCIPVLVACPRLVVQRLS